MAIPSVGAFATPLGPVPVDADARAVARRLGIPYYLLNTEREFARAVIEPFARAYVERILTDRNQLGLIYRITDKWGTTSALDSTGIGSTATCAG